MTGQSKTADLNGPLVTHPGDGLEVMSHVILDFAKPLLETCNDAASEQKAISLAIFVWNTALLPDQERRQTIEAYLARCREAVPPDEVQTLSSFIERLLQDKEARFSDNRQRVTNCTFGDFGNNRHIEVGYHVE